MNSVEASDNTRERCLQEVLVMLRQGGSEAVSLRAVARRLQLSSAAPYRHFTSKEDMLAALAERGFRLFARQLEDAVPQGIHLATEASLLDLGECYVRFAMENPEYYRLMFGGVIPDHRLYPELREAAKKAFAVLLKTVEVLQRQGLLRTGNAVQLAQHVWSLGHGFSSLQMSNKFEHENAGSKLESRIRQHMQLLLQGLRAPA